VSLNVFDTVMIIKG